MKYCIRLLTVLALLLSVLPATVCAPNPLASESPTYSDGFSISDITGTWRIVRLTCTPIAPVPIVEYGSMEISSDGSTAISVQTPGGSITTTNCTMTISPDGQVAKDGNPWGVLSFDSLKILASGTGAGNWLALCTRPGTDVSPEDMAGSWRMHSLSLTPTAQDWRILTGTADNAGNLSGSLISSSPGPNTYSATLDIETDGGLQIVDGEGLTGRGQATPDGLLFAHAAGSVPAGTARFDVGVRLGGSFITADLKGDWHFHGIGTSGDQFYGQVTCAADGSFSGVSHNSSGSTNEIAGAFGITPNGSLGMTIGGVQMFGQGTLSLDRSFFAITWTEEDRKTLMVATKHPTDVQASVDVTAVQMNWGNGFSINEPMDNTWETPLCNLPAVAVNPANFQKPTPPPGAMAAAGLVYGQDGNLQPPVYTPGKIALPAMLSGNGNEIGSRFMPELALYGWPWPTRTGDIELRAVIDAIHGDPATQVGNGVVNADVGFSVMDGTAWSGDTWMSFGFATLYLTNPIGELGSGYYNRQPFISFGNNHGGSEGFSVAPANGYDPAYPVELKVVVTTSKLARYFAHFGPPEAEWTLCGEAQLDWWPAPETGAGGCGTNAGQGLTWYSPYVSSSFEYVDVSGPEAPTPLEIATTSLPAGTIGESYDQLLEATGGAGPYSWQCTSGELPPCISLQNDRIVGYPCEEGVYRFTIRCTGASEEAYDEQEYTLVINRNLTYDLQGNWTFNRLQVGRNPSEATAYYGRLEFDSTGSCTVYAWDMTGEPSTHSFSVTALPDGTLLVENEPWGVLSMDGNRIIAGDYSDTDGSILICRRVDPTDVFDPADSEGTWRMHSFIAGATDPGWKATDGGIDSSGAFTGTTTNGDGSSEPYAASVSLDTHGQMQINEPGNTLSQHSGMNSNRIAFGRVMGSGEPTARFDIGLRTGGSFANSDLQGEWRLQSVSIWGNISRGSVTVNADGDFTGEIWDSDNGIQQVSGTMSVDEDGNLSISDDAQGDFDGQGTLNLNRDFFIFTMNDGGGSSVMLADKRPTESTSSVDVTQLHIDWGNGFVVDDPLDLDTEGMACDGPSILVDPSYLTTPGLPEGASMQAFYTDVDDSESTSPSFEPGKFVLSRTLAPGFGESECVGVAAVSTQNLDWPAQSQPVEVRAVFENLQGDLDTGVGGSTIDCSVGFHVSQGDMDLGDIRATFGLLTAYFHRGIDGIPAGVYNHTPYAGVFADEDEGNSSMDIILPTGYDPAQPVEVKLVVTPEGYAHSYLRFGAGDWIPTGTVQAWFWPGTEGYGMGCHTTQTGEQITFVPFIAHTLEDVEISSPQIEPGWIDDPIVGSQYDVGFWSEGGISPFAWSISSGSLPPGLELSEEGWLSGTPLEAGTFEFTVRVEDSQSPSAVAERIYQVNVIQPVSIQDAKALPDDARVAILNAVVTRRADEGYYVENPDRSAGIKISYWGFLAEGWTVNIIGPMGTDWNGERTIYGNCEVVNTEPVSIRPIGMATRSIGGTDFMIDPAMPSSGQHGVVGGYGLNNVGLLVKTWGRVTQIDPSGQYFYVDDGCRLKDSMWTGMEENIGVRVQRSPMDLEPGDYVTITGISGCMRDYSYGPRPCLKACDVQVQFPARPPFVLGTPEESPGSCQIIFMTVLGASGYRLYQSTDGRQYSPTTAQPQMFDTNGVFQVTQQGNMHYRVAALGPDEAEGRQSKDVYARIADPRVHFDLDNPSFGSDWVPLNPSICVPYVDGAVRLGMEIRESSSGENVWGVIQDPMYGWCTSYGQRGAVAAYVPATALLAPQTGYRTYVYAIDAGNWSFADCGEWPFRTGDGYGGDSGGGGGGNPPPPPL